MSLISKLLLSFLLFVLLLLAGQCGNPSNPHEFNELLGEYRWVESSGGIAGATLTPESEGYEQSIIFESASKYFTHKNDSSQTTVCSGLYRIAFEETWNENDSAHVIHMGDNERAIIELKNDTLYLTDLCYDCFGHTYIRVEKI